jgi:Fe-S-cluster-containing dehydrogenase component
MASGRLILDEARLGLRHHLHLERGCTLCDHRIERNLLPACVQHCLARAIRLERRA